MFSADIFGAAIRPVGVKVAAPQGERRMKNTIPNGPWQNPLIEDDLYDAQIAHVVKGVYGNAEHPYLKIVCIIQTEDVYFTTNLYFKAGGTIKSDRRLWHFCECIGEEKADVLNDPGCCNGKRLCLRVKCIQKKNANYGNPYMDVERFLPPLPASEETQSGATTGGAAVDV
jgi:rRNA processing protein Gar1